MTTPHRRTDPRCRRYRDPYSIRWFPRPVRAYVDRRSRGRECTTCRPRPETT